MGFQGVDAVQPQAELNLDKPFAVALQGGGSYGAFAWGVLERLLEEESFDPVALSGSSAGAVNAVLVAWGLQSGGREGASRALRKFWESVGQMSWLSPMGLPGAHLQFDLLTRVASPYQFNPLNINPMRDLLLSVIDFDRLAKECTRGLFIAATDVSSGDQRIFRENEITVDVLMASTCIPYLHQAVEIDGHQHWDGGFSANPPVMPLVLETQCRSVLVVKLTPDSEPGHPTAAPAIFSRLKRILFNTPLLRELDALGQMQRVLRRTSTLSADLRRIRDVTVPQATIGSEYFSTSASAIHPRPELLDQLRLAGRGAAEDLLGARATQSISA